MGFGTPFMCPLEVLDLKSALALPVISSLLHLLDRIVFLIVDHVAVLIKQCMEAILLLVR